MRIDGDVIQIDPQLLFQRLTLAAKSQDNLEVIFKYELCSYPPALFSGPQFLRDAQKPVLANAIWTLLPQSIPGLSSELQYVLDGGALLQRIPWTKGATYKEICTSQCILSMSQGNMGMQLLFLMVINPNPPKT